MPPDGSSLPEMLTQELDRNDPQTQVVRAQLEELIREAAIDGDRDDRATLPRLKPLGRGPSWRLSLLLACLSFALLLMGGFRDLVLVWANEMGLDASSSIDRFRETVLTNMIGQDAIFPGRGAEEKWCQKIRREFDLHPDSAASYYLYANFYLWREGEIPPDFDAVTSRLEPDNGIWPLLKSRWQLTQAVSHRTGPKVFDPAWIAEARESLREAAASPRIDHHLQEIGQFWRESFRPRTLLEALLLSPHTGSIDHVALHPEESATSALGPVARQIADPEERREFLKIAEAVMIRDSLSSGRNCELQSAYLAKIAEDGALSDEVNRFKGFEKLAKTERLQHLSLQRKGAGKFLDGSKFWPDFWDDSDDPGFPEFDLRLLNRVAVLKMAMLASGATCLLLGGLMSLRLIPYPVIPAKVARCIEPLVYRPRYIAVTALALFTTMIVAWGATGALAKSGEGFGVFFITIFAAALLGTAVVLQSARSHLSRAAAVAGVGASGRRLMIGSVVRWILLLTFGFWIASTYIEDFRIFAIALAGATILYWLFSVFFGYSRRVDAVRHRVMAGFLLPVFLVVSLTFAVFGLATGIVEKQLVQRAWSESVVPGQQLSEQTKDALRKALNEGQ